eukprot:10937362-Alexandrium_andersonii.AAC.1
MHGNVHGGFGHVQRVSGTFTVDDKTLDAVHTILREIAGKAHRGGALPGDVRALKAQFAFIGKTIFNATVEVRTSQQEEL